MAVRKIASQFVNPKTVHIFVGDGAGVDGKLVRAASFAECVCLCMLVCVCVSLSVGVFNAKRATAYLAWPSEWTQNPHCAARPIKQRTAYGN